MVEKDDRRKREGSKVGMGYNSSNGCQVDQRGGEGEEGRVCREAQVTSIA